MHRFRFALPLVVVAGIIATVASACSDQGEGERCTYFSDGSGNDDCNAGLVCTPRGALPSNPQSDICCPPVGSATTTQVCSLTSGIDGGILPDASDDAAETSSPDTGADASDASDAADAADGADAADTATPDANVPDTSVADAQDDGG